MAQLPIIHAPDPRLKVISKPVGKVDASTAKLLDDMLETMYAAPGIGLAAIQVGVPKRMLVIDLSKDDEPRKPLKIINPEVIDIAETDKVWEEGCLSLPEQYAEVERPEWVEIKYLDETGAERRLKADGVLAVCLQHEMDHLDGILFVDHISAVKRNMILRKLVKQRRMKATG
jgi:peptide deformylase